LFTFRADIPLPIIEFPAKPGTPGWNPYCRPVGMPFEIVMGRGLAFCVHPIAAWRRLPKSGRALLLTAYVSASYVIVLTALFIG